MAKRFPLKLYCGVSEMKSKTICEKHGFVTVMIPNDPLHRKWNVTVLRAKADNPDYCLFFGSDDIVNDELLHHYIQVMKRGADYIGALDWYFTDTVSKQGLYWGGYTEPYRRGVACGAGRAMSRNMLEMVAWKPWTPGHDNMLDTAFEKRIKGLNYTKEMFFVRDVPNGCGLDIKTKENMTPFAQWNNTILYFEMLPLLQNFFGEHWATQVDAL